MQRKITKLSDTAIDAIRENGRLYGEVCEQLEVQPLSLVRILSKNDTRLTQSGVIKAIKRHRPDLKDTTLLS